ncbi:MAG: ABC transporter permease [Chloroflexia bacterium]
MIGLLRAEWMKAIRQGTNLALVATVIGVAVLEACLVLYTATGGNGIPGGTALLGGKLGFPNGFLLPLGEIGALAMLIATIFVATVIGSEYTTDTWKNMLIRYPGRGRFLVAKLAAVGFALVTAVGAAMIISQALMLAGQAVFAGNATLAALKVVPLSANAFWSQLWQDTVPLALTLAPAAGVAALFTILGRSTVAGILLGIVWQTADSLLGQLLPSIAGFLVNPNINSLTRNLVKPGSGQFDQWQSVGVLVLYALVPTLVAIFIFRKRDIAG